ncbi:helix-turn-helix transcriptional regulator [Campylobacter avium]|uniref:helix-turn-helix transcriptional regulator n=1 Tax=Campylobacter avium TaxID=522485 RepID=UPI00255C23DF|nr:PAS domain-containing protein [Campylobacter avium]
MRAEKKEHFIKLCKFLGQVLGKRYEVVFHVIEESGAYIAAIENNQVSGRTTNSPLTAFASELVQNKSYLDKDFLCGYKAMVNKDKMVRGSTFFIKDKDKLEGILCINYDTSEMRDVVAKIIDIEKLDDMSSILNLKQEDDNNVEVLNHSIEEILAQYVDVKYLESDFLLTTEQKQSIISKLYKKGVFNVKGAISVVAKFLKLSEPSVYRYLGNVKKDMK